MPSEPRVELRPADALIIVPPFAGLDRPSLGVHVLQACAKARGVTVSVLYANLLLGGEVGEPTYQAVCYGPGGRCSGSGSSRPRRTASRHLATTTPTCRTSPTGLAPRTTKSRSTSPS